MAEPTLQDLFGDNASQDSSSIIIPKANLTVVGLTAEENNTAESLLVAILLLAKQYLNQTNYDGNIEQNVLIEDGISSFLNRGDNQTYRSDQLNITLTKIDIQSTISPDDY